MENQSLASNVTSVTKLSTDLTRQSLKSPLKLTSHSKQSKMLVVTIAMLLCLTAVTVSAGPSANCLQCICQAYGCTNHSWGGYYRIMWSYWADCGKPGSSQWACVHDMACSRQCVVAYMARYAKPPMPQTCETYARVHRSGKNGWQSWAATKFWNKVAVFCAAIPGGC
ncbi:hypothetical protein LSAT2_005626 [Lamellibrachia satsuma]|nr:hypothetical protein LSAT2_005626 [Lamellibrachia satsuma]